MTILREWCKTNRLYEECMCEVCSVTYQQTKNVGDKRRSRKLSRGRDLCVQCIRKENIEVFKNAGTKVLLARTADERRRTASMGGKSQALSPNQGRFQTERWNAMPPSEQTKQVTRAAAALHEKLKDPDLAAVHWKKVHAQRKIGYVSKAHAELHMALAGYGFIQHYTIGRAEVDECCPDKKLIVEYNGDYWHCNPSTWQPNDYNKSIKMTAAEKWKRDRDRNHSLRKLGYIVLVIWETDWKTDKANVLSKILEVYNEIGETNFDRT